MRLIGASFVFVCDDEFRILKNGGVLFENEEILEVGDYKTLESSYDNLESRFYEDSVLLPAFINTHIHFEFGANNVSFDYGGFELWLSSVMQHREEVLESLENILDSGIQAQLECGVGSVGAISSYGGDMQKLAASPLKVVYFSEVIGTKESILDSVLANFKSRYIASKKLESKSFFPSIAIHSPYSVHSDLTKQILTFAQKDSCIVSTHFLESDSERQWLTQAQGWFKDFYTNTLAIQNPKPFYTIRAFIEAFKGLHTLFVHCTNALPNELAHIIDSGAYIVTCPRSNRLLGGKMLDMKSLNAHTQNLTLQHLGFSALRQVALGTDGMSSNNNTNILDEMRAGLWGMDMSLLQTAKLMILCATNYAAKALRLNNGILQAGKSADMAIFRIPNISKSQQPELHFLLQASRVWELFINGEWILDSNRF